VLGDETQMNEDMPLYTDFAPHSGRFVWEGRPSMEALIALKQNEGRMIVTLPHPDTQEEVRGLVLHVEVPDQVVRRLEDEDTGEFIIPDTLRILCGPKADGPDRPEIALDGPHIRIHCNQVLTDSEPEGWLYPWS